VRADFVRQIRVSCVHERARGQRRPVERGERPSAIERQRPAERNRPIPSRSVERVDAYALRTGRGWARKVATRAGARRVVERRIGVDGGALGAIGETTLAPRGAVGIERGGRWPPDADALSRAAAAASPPESRTGLVALLPVVPAPTLRRAPRESARGIRQQRCQTLPSARRRSAADRRDLPFGRARRRRAPLRRRTGHRHRRRTSRRSSRTAVRAARSASSGATRRGARPRSR
jgi:hypothetical protein